MASDSDTKGVGKISEVAHFEGGVAARPANQIFFVSFGIVDKAIGDDAVNGKLVVLVNLDSGWWTRRMGSKGRVLVKLSVTNFAEDSANGIPEAITLLVLQVADKLALDGASLEFAVNRENVNIRIRPNRTKMAEIRRSTEPVFIGYWSIVGGSRSSVAEVDGGESQTCPEVIRNFIGVDECPDHGENTPVETFRNAVLLWGVWDGGFVLDTFCLQESTQLAQIFTAAISTQSLDVVAAFLLNLRLE
ncbi:hypothetical protein DFS34DRAFT_366138 [Phlyctochytrium arcticum]|nr:hypothetical protein DFS34DRAFT_366138 [Phlyctochytrium arcticum]